MPKITKTAKATTVQEQREPFRIEIEVGGADPIVRGHCHLVARDGDGAELGRAPGHVTVEAKLTAKLRKAIADIIDAVDGED